MHILAASFNIGVCQASLTQSTQQTGKLLFQTSALHARSGSLVHYSTLSSFTGAKCTTNREISISNMCISHTFWHTHSLQHFVLFHWCLACYKQGSVSFNTVIIAVNLCSNSDSHKKALNVSHYIIDQPEKDNWSRDNFSPKDFLFLFLFSLT